MNAFESNFELFQRRRNRAVTVTEKSKAYITSPKKAMGHVKLATKSVILNMLESLNSSNEEQRGDYNDGVDDKSMNQIEKFRKNILLCDAHISLLENKD